MTPAELLLAAADRIDQARADATPGPWFGEGDWVDAVRSSVAGFWHPLRNPADAAWIALLNPDTGGHIAALLRHIGNAMHAEQVSTSLLELRAVDAALTLARAILGGDR